MNENPAASSTSRVQIELEPGEPLHGALLSPAGIRRPFCGWIELANALNELREEADAKSGATEAGGRERG